MNQKVLKGVRMSVSISIRVYTVGCVISITTMILVGCIATSNQHYLSPEYRNRNLYQTTLLVMPLNREIIDSDLVNRHGYKQNTLTRQEHDYFMNYMGPALTEATTITIIGIDKQFIPEDIEFDYQNFSLGNKENLKMFAPISGQVIYQNQVPGYVLFFEDLNFKKNYFAPSSSSYSTLEQYSLTGSVEYLIWDNKVQKIVAYGEIKKKYASRILPTKSSFTEIFEYYAIAIIENSPFARRLKLRLY